jgi:hypothetical protein
MARNVQSYQQAQQINPLLLQQQQAETKRAGAEANVSEQTQEPRISKSQAESKKSEIEAQKAGVDLNQYYGNLSKGVYGGFVFDPDFINGNSEAMVKKLTAAHDYLTKDIGIPESGSKATDQLINLAKTNPKQAYQMIKNGIMQSGQNQSQVAAVAPQLTTNAAGNLVQVTPAGGGISMVGGAINELNPKGVRSAIVTNPVTGQPTAVPLSNTGQYKQSTNQGQPNAGGPNALTPMPPNQTAETLKTQATDNLSLYQKAVDTMTNPSSKNGFIPDQKKITANIIHLLKDKDVDTGPIANYFATNTGQESLNPKQQELAKYLEQRIQNQNPQSVQDLASMHKAYGSISLKKDALIDLMRNEAGTITANDLFNRGIIKNGGNGINPDLNAINNFKSQFAMYANDPTLMKIIAVTGESPKARIDKEDKDALNKILSGMTKEQKAAMAQKRENLLRLVNGQ